LGDMSSLLSILLQELHKYGYPILWLIIFMAAVGLPLPASLVLLAAGDFAAHGDFNIALLIGITITAASCGDSVGYSEGGSSPEWRASAFSFTLSLWACFLAEQ